MRNSRTLPRVFHPALNLLLACFGLVVATLSIQLSGQTPSLNQFLGELFNFFDSPITALGILLGSFMSIYVAMFVGEQRISCWLVLAGLLGFACPVAESFVMTVAAQNFLIDVMAIVGIHAAVIGLSMGMVWYVFKDEGQAIRTNGLPRTQLDQ